MKNYYEILSVSESITMEELKKVYRNLAKKYHPDRYVNSSEEEQKRAKDRFAEINEAYETLSDEKLRQEYDRKRGKQGERGSKSQYNSNEKFNRADFFNKNDINNMFSNFFSQSKTTEERSDDNLKKNMDTRFRNFFGFKGKR